MLCHPRHLISCHVKLVNFLSFLIFTSIYRAPFYARQCFKEEMDVVCSFCPKNLQSFVCVSINATNSDAPSAKAPTPDGTAGDTDTLENPKLSSKHHGECPMAMGPAVTASVWK